MNLPTLCFVLCHIALPCLSRPAKRSVPDIEQITDFCTQIAIGDIKPRVTRSANQNQFDSVPLGLSTGYFDLNKAENIPKSYIEAYEFHDLSPDTRDPLVDKLSESNIKEIRMLRDRCIIRELESKENNGAFEQLYRTSKSPRSSLDVWSIDDEGQGKKRASAGLSLNPTGWRRKRFAHTNTDQEEYLRRYFENMRQLNDKRQKLNFNPTGW